MQISASEGNLMTDCIAIMFCCLNLHENSDDSLITKYCVFEVYYRFTKYALYGGAIYY